jgi:hypothetical protein
MVRVRKALALTVLFVLGAALAVGRRPRVVDRGPEPLRVRAVQITPREGAVELRDPQRVAEDLTISTEAASLLSYLDGTRDLEAVIREVTEGMSPQDAGEWEGRTRKLAQALDEGLFLQNHRFESAYHRLRDAFGATPVREARFTRGVDLVRLRRRFEGAPSAPRAVIAPHIDYSRGEEVYGRVYGLVRGGLYRRVVILGTLHAPNDGRFILCRKGFETPLGICPLDREFAARLETGYDFPRDEFAHRGEHSIELQLPWLQAALRPDVPIVPILCGSLEAYFDARRAPDGLDFERFVGALRRAVALSEGATLLVAASDLSHIGPRFGDAEMPDLAKVEHSDRLILGAAARGDANEAFAWAAIDGNARRICGMTPIVALLRALQGARGQVLAYMQCAGASQCVSIAGMRLD